MIQRDPGDIELIEQQEQLVTKLHDDVNYIKQELIEARSHKAASDDELGNVKGGLESLQNNITSLSEEGNWLLFIWSPNRPNNTIGLRALFVLRFQSCVYYRKSVAKTNIRFRGNIAGENGRI